MRNFLSICTFMLLACGYSINCHADQQVKSYKGYWVYGFEQSVLKTCGGELYWMWVPKKVEGKYSQEGSNNPAEVTGYILPPDPDNNVFSSLKTFQLKKITLINDPC